MKATDDIPLFTLHVSPPNAPKIIIRAFKGTGEYTAGEYTNFSHTRIDVEVRQGGKVVFPLGQLYCGMPSGAPIHGNAAKEYVLRLVEMRPGDTDRNYFADYAPGQLAWVERYGDLISCERQFRYCDKNGNLRRN